MDTIEQAREGGLRLLAEQLNDWTVRDTARKQTLRAKVRQLSPVAKTAFEELYDAHCSAEEAQNASDINEFRQLQDAYDKEREERVAAAKQQFETDLASLDNRFAEKRRLEEEQRQQ